MFQSNILSSVYIDDYILIHRQMFKKTIRARSDLLLNISLAGGQSFKWINHEREARMINPITTDRQTVIY